MTTGQVAEHHPVHKHLGRAPSGSREDGSYALIVVEPRHSWYLPVKRAIELCLTLMLLLCALPIVLIAALLVKVSSPGPAFYFQTRLGRHRRPFTLIKLRTMVYDAESITGPVWACPDDDRVTWIGRRLRNSHIDEFPQLLNVLLGHMSLIGPRPERPEFIARLELELPYYQNRLSVRPGITGLAQLLLPPDSNIESVRRKLQHDLYYVRYASPLLDLRITLATVHYLSKYFWHCIKAVFRLPNAETVEHRIDRLVRDGVEAASAKVI